MELKKLSDSVQQLSEWLEKSHLFAKSVKERQDLRLHHLDTKRAQVEQKLERTGRELTKNMVEIENKLNSLRKELAESPKPPTTPERRIAKAITILRREGMISSLAYSRKLGVSRSIAAKDLARMSGMGIVRKRGSGRSAYYLIRV
jgi:Fic family protein